MQKTGQQCCLIKVKDISAMLSFIFVQALEKRIGGFGFFDA
jgi:hypothetical protein